MRLGDVSDIDEQEANLFARERAGKPMDLESVCEDLAKLYKVSVPMMTFRLGEISAV